MAAMVGSTRTAARVAMTASAKRARSLPHPGGRGQTARQCPQAVLVTGHREGLTRGTQAYVQLVLGDVDTDEDIFSHVPSLQIRARRKTGPSDCTGSTTGQAGPTLPHGLTEAYQE